MGDWCRPRHASPITNQINVDVLAGQHVLGLAKYENTTADTMDVTDWRHHGWAPQYNANNSFVGWGLGVVSSSGRTTTMSPRFGKCQQNQEIPYRRQCHPYCTMEVESEVTNAWNAGQQFGTSYPVVLGWLTPRRTPYFTARHRLNAPLRTGAPCRWVTGEHVTGIRNTTAIPWRTPLEMRYIYRVSECHEYAARHRHHLSTVAGQRRHNTHRCPCLLSVTSSYRVRNAWPGVLEISTATVRV